ncbi:hypothetical protein IAR55_006231 [Kwoniella newhampshirensis]|uniref:SET domain-containing protein n=1 Tax=Kwoniella newhampshirensis TaxID=1651941 RepID=A0AAW0YIY4_9TREE
MSSSLASSLPTAPSASTPTLADIQIYSTVRQTFNQVWNDFYEWKPPSTLPLADDGLLKAAERQDVQQVRRHGKLGRKLAALSAVEDIVSIPTPDSLAADSLAPARRPIIPSSSTSTPGGSSYSSSSATPDLITWRRPSGDQPGSSSKKLPPPKLVQPRPPKEGSFALTMSIPVTRVPSYTFCVGGTSSIWKPESKSMPFIPCFGDDADFDELEYSKKFGMRREFDEPGRDADIEIILVETIRRLKQTNVTPQQADSTRVLPQPWATIENVDLDRDLPPFPRRPDFETEGQRPVKRKWEPPLEVPEEEVNPSDMQDMFECECARPGCVRVGCTRHTGIVDGTFMLKYSDHVRPEEESSVSRSTVLSLLNGSCPNNCHSPYTLSELEIMSIKSPRKWPEAEREMLKSLLFELDNLDCRSVCVLREAHPNRTCLEVVLETLSILGSVEPSVSPAAHEPDPLTRPTTLAKTKSKSFRIPIPTAKHNSFDECDHTGPCVAGECKCANTDWPCGRNCGCPPSCMRRHQGCQCKRAPRYSSTGVKRTQRVCLPEKCPCRINRRECDPELCGSCGAAEELDIRHRRDYPTGRFRPDNGEWEDVARDTQGWVNCSNVQLQKANWPKLRVGISPVAGYGLFADQDISSHVVLGEYVGEVISHLEGLRRDQVNKHIGRTYLFSLNEDAEIDSASYGNETRFINSGKGNEVNCGAAVTIVHNEQRVYFQTLRPIKRHEEIRFDYGPSFNENGSDNLVAKQNANKKAKR